MNFPDPPRRDHGPSRSPHAAGSLFMRIIAGKAGRIAIKVPTAVSRPTTDFVRQAIFSILGESIQGARILDLFAGSGALGLEALSRGAASCTFVEENGKATAVIGENLKKARLQGGQIAKSDVSTFLKRDSSLYDVILADPPYYKHHGDKDHIGQLLSQELIIPRLNPNGYFIAEISANQKTPDSPGLTLLARREYGSSAILIFELSASQPISSTDH
ncbi:MAG: 16S rRNA (guanine(966)-N(2))-methyltransferase RsmD [Luteolibacter sp.]